MSPKRSMVFMTIVGGLTLVCLAASDAGAMPMFARKLGVGCATCHTTIPRLNETGFKFRAAGWRMAEDIGKPEDKAFNLGDYFSGRLQAQYLGSHAKTGPTTSSNSELTFTELTLYPVTGSFEKYYSSLVELSFAPEEPAEVENGYVRMDRGNGESFWQGRVGIFHPWEGFGASDRPISINRPYIQRQAANFNQSTFFTTWGFDQAGAEFGYDYKRASVRAAVFNGITLKEEEGTVIALPAQGGPLSKPDTNNKVDFQAFANYRLDEDGGGVSLHYYHGYLDLPLPSSTIDEMFQNSFDRIGIYAGKTIVPKAQVFGAYQYGRDHSTSTATFSSQGAFLEADFPIHRYATPGVRYDYFDKAKNKTDNTLNGVFAFVNVPFQNGLQFIAEYQHRRTERGADPNRTDNIFQIRFIFIQ